MATKPVKKRTTAPPPTSKPSGKSVSRKKSSSSRNGKFESIRLDLEQQREELLGEAAAFPRKPDLGAFPDMTDQASVEVEKSFDIRLREREQKLIKKIDEALDRMGKNTYGICEDCKADIPLERLKARPVTTLCIECKTIQEEEEKAKANKT